MTLQRRVQRTSQDQYTITIPKVIIELLKIAKGTGFSFSITKQGDILLKRVRK